MLDQLGQVAFFGAFAVPPVVIGVVLYLLRRHRPALRIVVALLYAVVAFVGLMRIGLAILLRDGLAVGMIVSQGSVAVERALPGIIEGVLVEVIVVASFLPLVRRGRGVPEHGREYPPSGDGDTTPRRRP